MLEKVGIFFTVRGRGLISIKRKQALEIFASDVNFIEGVVACRGKKKGIEKRVLLERLLKN